MVPEGWQASTLGECVSIRSGGTPSKQKPEFWGGTVPWVSAKDLKTHLISDAQDHLTDQGAERAKMAAPKSVLMLVRGMTLLKDVPIGFVTKPVAFNQDLKALVANDTVAPKFLSYLLVAKKLQMMGLVNTANHGTGRLDTDLLKALPVDIPPLPEQRKIADILSTWDAAIEKTEALLATARTQKRALMQSLLTGRRRFPEFEGQDWKEVRLGDVADIRIGGTPARKEPTYWQDGNNIWLSIADLGPKHLVSSKERITDQGVAKSNVKLLPVGSVVMSFKLTIGKLGITAVPLYTNEAICGFVPRTHTSFHPEFLYQLLHVADLLQDVDQAVKGKTLNKAKLNELHLRMPDIAEQRRISDFMVSMDREVENWTSQLEKLRTEKKALMQQLLTGKRRVVV